MKKLLSLIPVLLLTGCFATAVPVAPKFPDVPKDLLEECPELALTKVDTEKLSDVISVVNKNYQEYHTCRLKVADWIDWYVKQSKNFEKLK